MVEVSQDALAKLSGVSGQTIIAFENGKRQPYTSTIEKIRAALESAGVEFIEENGGGPGVRLANPQKP